MAEEKVMAPEAEQVKAAKKPAAKKAAEKPAAEKKTAAKKPAAEEKPAAKAAEKAPAKKPAAKKAAAKAENMVTIKLVRSFCGRKDNQIATAKSLGLKRIGDVTVQPDNTATNGKLAKIAHLVQVIKA